MKKTMSIVGAFAAGAGAAYFFDPIGGRRRRALVRDKAVHLVHLSESGLDVGYRDLTHRVYGKGMSIRGALSEFDVPDDILIERVRARLGRVVSHPHAIHVQADKTRVTLTGYILEEELNAALAAVKSTRGVTEVENNLELHKATDQIPSLQGGKARPGIRSELFQYSWSPAARITMGTIGGLFTIFGFMSRSGVLGRFLGFFGLGVLARALTNVEAKSLVGVGRKSHVHVHKTVNIHAPIEQVYSFWTKFENFPEFIPGILDVKAVSKDVYRWTVKGPAGVPVHWNGMITQLVPNKLISWKSVDDSTVENVGVIHFHPMSERDTRIDIDVTYQPPVGAIGHGLAMLFGADPRSKINDHVMRVKSHLEAESIRS